MEGDPFSGKLLCDTGRKIDMPRDRLAVHARKSLDRAAPRTGNNPSPLCKESRTVLSSVRRLKRVPIPDAERGRRRALGELLPEDLLIQLPVKRPGLAIKRLRRGFKMGESWPKNYRIVRNSRNKRWMRNAAALPGESCFTSGMYSLYPCFWVARKPWLRPVRSGPDRM